MPKPTQTDAGVSADARSSVGREGVLDLTLQDPATIGVQPTPEAEEAEFCLVFDELLWQLDDRWCRNAV